MDIPDYIKKRIGKFASPGLTLKDEVIIATIMEDCRDRILKRIYDKRYFIDNLAEDIKRIHPKSRYTLLDGFTAKTMRTRNYRRKPRCWWWAVVIPVLSQLCS